MSNRARTRIFAVITLAGLVTLIYFASHFILLGTFVSLEERDTRANMQRVLKAFNQQLENIATIATGYSVWDDTYRFVEDANPAFVELNMMDETFIDYNVGLIMYLNNDLDVVFEKAVDLTTGEERGVPADLDAHLAPDSPLVTHSSIESIVNGIVRLSDGYAIVTSQPVITSEGNGPINGVQVWGRMLDDTFFEQLTEATDFEVTAVDFRSASPPDDFAQAKQYIRGDGDIFVEPIDNTNIVAGYTVLNDLYGDPALMLRLSMPRTIYQHGQASVGVFMLATVVSAVVVAVLAQARVSLQEENDVLERGVAERTAELQTANTQLRQEIAERMQAEQQLAQARDQALEALRLKTQILANVSHDARTPLTTIMLRTELMQYGRYGKMSDDQLKALEIIMVNSRQLLGFVSNLLTEAQLSGDKIHVANTAFSPGALLDEIYASMAPLAERKGLQLATMVAGNVPQHLTGDPTRIRQIVSNLIENGIKFTDSGRLTVSVDLPDDGHWAIHVADTGRGIPKDAHDRIFEPFWQLDGSMTRDVNRGVGLGLSIVRQLATLLGAAVHVDSEPGKGSTFTVVFPLPSQEGEAAHGPTVGSGYRG